MEAVLSHVARRGVAVQAGGNLGIFPKYLSERFGTVYSFEPEPELFRMATCNAPEKNIVWMQAALGSEHGQVGMSRVRRGVGNSHEGIAHVSGGGNIPVLLVDDLALDVCDLLYLDIEGHELLALQGARETIARCRPVVACEINKSLEFTSHTEEDVRAFVRMQGYEHAGRVRSDEIFVPR